MRGILRAPARQDGVLHRRRAKVGIREVAWPAARASEEADGLADSNRRARFPQWSLRDVPQHRGHGSIRHSRTGSYPPRQPAHDCRRNFAAHHRQSRRLDPRSAEHQAGGENATQSDRSAVAAGAARLSGDSQVMAYSQALPMRDDDRPAPAPLITADVENDIRAKLSATWKEPSGLWGWMISTNHKSIAKRYIVTALIFFALDR